MSGQFVTSDSQSLRRRSQTSSLDSLLADTAESSGSGDDIGNGGSQALLGRLLAFLLTRAFGSSNENAKNQRMEPLSRMVGYSKPETVILQCKNCEKQEHVPVVFQNAEDFICAKLVLTSSYMISG